MWDVLSALIPPAVVATVFCVAICTLLRKEMAPRTADGRPIDEGESPETKEADNKVAAESQDTPRASDAEVRDTEEEHKGR